MTATGAEPTQGSDHLVNWMLVAISVAATALPVTLGLLVALRFFIDIDQWLGSALLTLGLWGAIGGTIAAAAIIAVLLIRPPRARGAARLAATLGAFAGATPVSLVLFFMIQRSECVIINLFGFPWSEPWPVIGQALTAAVVLGALVFLVKCFVIPSTRRSALAVLGWWLVAFVPSVILYALSFFGHPGPGCIIR